MMGRMGEGGHKGGKSGAELGFQIGGFWNEGPRNTIMQENRGKGNMREIFLKRKERLREGKIESKRDLKRERRTRKRLREREQFIETKCTTPLPPPPPSPSVTPPWGGGGAWGVILTQ